MSHQQPRRLVDLRRALGWPRRRRTRRITLDEAPAALEQLLDGILSFWDERMIDHRQGGYALGHDNLGRPTGSDSRHLVTQARVIWFFARLGRSRYGSGRHLGWAEHGVRYLEDRMWDDAFGGFFWEVGPEGVREARKHLYGQAFAIYALAEYALATGDTEARARALELFDLCDRHAHDERHGGYLECREPDWSPEPPDAVGVLGAPARWKLLNTHLHLMEALIPLTALEPGPLGEVRLRELVQINSAKMLDPVTGSCREALEADWTLAPGMRASYGHDVENARLLLEACAAAGLPAEPLDLVLAGIWDHALAFGFDHERGGFFDSGSPGEPADRRSKVWWVQAEGLAGALSMWRRTRDEHYLDAFELTLGWIAGAQADEITGDWHDVVDTRGRASGDKSGPWNDPYHQGRAVLECLEALVPSSLSS